MTECTCDLRKKLEEWRDQIIEFSNSPGAYEGHPGPLYSMAISAARAEILSKLDELLEEK